jgi:hypothetical protein
MKTREQAEIGIKQVLCYRWMAAAARMAAAGMDEGAMRATLHETLRVEGEEGGKVRSAQTRAFAVNNLVRIWGPAAEPLRMEALAVLGEAPDMALAVHWAMTAAAYPFWAETAVQIGRLLTLQEAATQVQIVQRLRERYGDRPTVGRYARYVIRAMVDWEVLCDAPRRGVYARADPLVVNERAAALLAGGGGQRAALFAFVM